MSDFKCEVIRVRVEEHPNADAIAIAKVGDYQSIVRKGQINDGDLAVYIPEQAVIPEWLLRQMGLWDDKKEKGGLAGSMGNRVKAIKLRGVLSQGLILPGEYIPEHFDGADELETCVKLRRPDGENVAFAEMFAIEGCDVSEFLDIVKYESPLPSHMAGRVLGMDLGATHKYDFDNLKKTPTLFDDDEEVIVTEKIHGTLMMVGIVPSKDANEKYHQQRVVVSSKGQSAKGYILDHDDEGNMYAQAAKKHGLLDSMLEAFGEGADRQGLPIFIIGEVFGKTLSGKSVQEGFTYADKELDFAAFDICVGNRGSERYLEWDHFEKYCSLLGVKTVPVLYRGPYSKQIVLDHTDGNTILSDRKQIREGVVVKSAIEGRHPHFGRKIAKSISEAYLLRKGNTTEFN